MILGGLQKLTALDFPGVVSALVFTQGCNFRCPYCHNAGLIPARPLRGAAPAPGVDEVAAFLEKRKGLLDGVAITGGEPCLQPNLGLFCRRVKELGYAVKLDTNGSFPRVVAGLLEDGLVDYVAVDVKTAPAAYAPDLAPDARVGEKLCETIAVLSRSGVPFEARTTCAAPFVTPETVASMADAVPPSVPWFFQRVTLPPSAPEGSPAMRALTDDEIRALLPATHSLAQLRSG